MDKSTIKMLNIRISSNKKSTVHFIGFRILFFKLYINLVIINNRLQFTGVTSMHYQKILVATDLSENGNRAFAVAEQYRNIAGGVITPANALNEPVWPEGIRLPSLDDAATKKLMEFSYRKCREAAEKHTPAEFVDQPYISYGDPARTIVGVSAGYDILVMSTHGRTGFRKFVMGSVASKVCRMSKAPVLVTSPEDSPRPFKRILLTTDFSDESCKAFDKAHWLLQNTDAVFTLLHVLSIEYAGGLADKEELYVTVADRLNRFRDEHFAGFAERVQTHVIVSGNSVHRAISKHLSADKYDLIIISTAGRTGMDYVVLGSTAAHIIQTAPVPVLTVRP